jgi:hypothetical protein
MGWDDVGNGFRFLSRPEIPSVPPFLCVEESLEATIDFCNWVRSYPVCHPTIWASAEELCGTHLTLEREAAVPRRNFKCSDLRLWERWPLLLLARL